MDTNDDKDIRIYKVKGGDPGDDLLGCYFKPQGDGKYKFYDTKHNEKGKDLKKDSKFSFDLDGIGWTLTIDSISDSAASGTWVLKFTIGPGDADDHTFQAQAGTPVRHEQSAASAVA